MSVLVYVEPTTTLPPKPTARECMRWTWYGVDGSVWSLGRQAGAYVLRSAVVGMLHPAFIDHVSASPAVDGQFYRSTRTLPRSLGFRIRLRQNGSRDFVETHRAFWRSWSPHTPGRLEIASIDSTRSIWLRLQSSGDAAFDADPQRWAMLTMDLEAIADDPYWLGEPIERSWGTSTPVPFYGPSGAGPSFWISSASTIDSATVTNPGDAESWPVWTIESTGVTSGVSLTVDGGRIQLPGMVAGEAIRIDTHPAYGGAQRGSMVDGTFVATDPDIDGEFDLGGSRRIPPGQSVPVGISMTGSGSVSVSFTPRYWLAF